MTIIALVVFLIFFFLVLFDLDFFEAMPYPLLTRQPSIPRLYGHLPETPLIPA